MDRRYFCLYAGVFLPLLLAATPALSTPMFFTDEASWAAAANAPIEGIDTTASALTCAEEVASPPGTDDGLGADLTFLGSSCGLAIDFKASTLEAGASFVYDDNSLPSMTQALSVGRIDIHEDDDWEVVFLEGQVIAFAFDLGQNNATAGGTDEFCVFTNDAVTPPVCTTSVPFTEDVNETQFFGVVANQPMSHVRWDSIISDPSAINQDDIAISNFRFVVPEAETGLLVLLGLAGLLTVKKRDSPAKAWIARSGRSPAFSGAASVLFCRAAI